MCSFLTVEAGLYLPPHHCINIYFMKEILAKKKKTIKINQVVHLYIKQYDELSVEKIMEFCQHHPAVYEYLPLAKDIMQLPR